MTQFFATFVPVFVFSFQVMALSLGDSMPSHSEKMKNIDEKEILLSDAKGKKGTLVIFSCNHCPYVKGWLDRMVSIGNEYQSKGISVVMINSNDPAKDAEDSFDAMKKVATEKGMKFPYVVDATSKAARSFGASKTPEVFLFNSSGKLIYTGAIDDNMKEPGQVTKTYLKDALDAVVAGKKVAVNETKSIGCGIRFRPKAE